jgi:flagellar hook-basal body complex protein FliE
MNQIAPIAAPPRAVEIGGSERASSSAPAAGGSDFGDLLSGAIDEARAKERMASEAAVGFAQGDPGVGIHEVMIASEKANLSLRYAVTLKNKLLDAYRELMSTAV